VSSLHPPREYTPAEVVAASNREIPKTLETATLGLFVLGAIVFAIGLFVDPDRAWSAFHQNWLYFTVLSSAGVTFVVVQRITTARWSRSVIRFMEGYVAFLPVAFVFLLLTLFVGRNHIFPWTREAFPNPEKAVYYNGTFLTIRDIVIVALLNIVGIWYIYTSLRLDVGRLPEWGAKWAEGLRAKMRQGFGNERRE
jgi:uncharacterized membrane protein YiaA